MPFAVARLTERSMIHGISSRSCRRAIRSTLVMVGTLAAATPSIETLSTGATNPVLRITGIDTGTSSMPASVNTGRFTCADARAGAEPRSITTSSSARPGSRSNTRVSRPASDCSSSGMPGCSSIAWR